MDETGRLRRAVVATNRPLSARVGHARTQVGTRTGHRRPKAGQGGGLPAERNGTILPCLPCYPHVTPAVVDKDDWRRTVAYGELGRVSLTALQEGLFLPNVLDRDQAVRHDLGPRWPCDGVANVHPLQINRQAPEGVY